VYICAKIQLKFDLNSTCIMQNVWKIATFVLALLLVGYVGYNLGTKNHAPGVTQLSVPENPSVKTVKTGQKENVLKEIEKPKPKLVDIIDLKEKIKIETKGGYWWGISGGFRDVEVIVSNDTEYNLDKVLVYVYVKRINDEIYYEQYFNLENIAPHNQMSIKIPNQDKGQKPLFTELSGFSIKSLEIDYHNSNYPGH
jgi:hypothetical protein